jgi:hypothetical protein
VSKIFFYCGIEVLKLPLSHFPLNNPTKVQLSSITVDALKMKCFENEYNCKGGGIAELVACL